MNTPLPLASFGDELVAAALNAAVEQSPDGILLLDRAGTIRWSNPGADAMLATAPLLGRDAWSLLETDARERLRPRVEEALGALGRWSGTVVIGADAPRAQVRLAVARVEEAAAPVHTTWHLTRLDPFEMRQDELRAMIDALPIGVFLNGPDGDCQWVNATYAALTGIPREALLGDGWQQALLGDRATYAALMREALATTGRLGPIEVPYRGADGGERTASVRIRTLHDDAGQVRGHAGVVADISAIRDSRLALAASEERLRTLLTTIEEGIVMHDAAGEICLWNGAAERILGMSGDQLVGRSPLDPTWRTIDAEGRALAGDAHPAMVALRTGAPVRDFVMGVMRGDAVRTWIRVTALPITLPGPDGQHGVVASFVDITEQRALAERAAVRERLGGVARFVGQLAHEFANSLMVVQARLELLGTEPGPQASEDLGALHQAVARAAELTEALRALGGREAVALEPTDLEGMISRMRSELPEADRARTRLLPSLHHEGRAEALLVNADPRLLRRVLATICAQMTDGAPSGNTGAMSLQLESLRLVEPLVEPHGEIAAGRWTLLRCRRERGGVSDAVLASLMAPDFVSRHAQPDIGVDLPVALARMQRMGGHLSARRIGVDGSELLLWLRPAAEAAHGAGPSIDAADVEAPAQPRTRRTPWMASEALTIADEAGAAAWIGSPPAEAATRDLQGLRVLLVDDDPLVLRTAERLLQRVGCVVTTATGGDEAATLLDAGAPAIDLLVTDVVMPGLSGPALVARLRARGDGRPVVYMSGYTGDAFSAAAELDEDAILVAKPFTTATLVGAMREALGANGMGR